MKTNNSIINVDDRDTRDVYWQDGTPYCAGCVECDTPAIEAAEAIRAPGVGRCGCCGQDFTREYYPCCHCEGDGTIDRETCSYCDGTGEARDE